MASLASRACVGRDRGPGRLLQPGQPLGPGLGLSAPGLHAQRGKERAQVTGGRGRQRAVGGDLPGAVHHVHHRGLLVPGAELAVPEPEVQWRPGHHDQVRLPEGHRAGPGH